MQIVIDIPEEIYERFGHEYSEENLISKHTNDVILEAFCKGTPLPKGHGRLIDADRIIAEATERMKYPANHKFMECVIAHMNLASTIIEADTESEEV